MTKKIAELTDDEIYEYVYCKPEACVDYNDRKAYPDDNNIPAKNISYDNCRYCKENNFMLMCGLECKRDKSVIDYQAIRTGIYKDDEVEVREND